MLRLLAQAYLLANNAATALQCVHALRQLEHADASCAAVHLIVIQAHVMVSFHMNNAYCCV